MWVLNLQLSVVYKIFLLLHFGMVKKFQIKLHNFVGSLCVKSKHFLVFFFIIYREIQKIKIRKNENFYAKTDFDNRNLPFLCFTFSSIYFII